MAVGLTAPESLLIIDGIRIGTACAGIKYADRRDLVVFALDEGAECAAVFTRNAFCAAPVIVAREHLAETSPRLLVINSGNAKAGTGKAGLEAAQATCVAAATQAAANPQQVLPFSTGVIGEPLPVDKITAALPAAIGALAADNWLAAATAIMTTDTVAKGVSRTVMINGVEVHITGIAKGAGMIRPDMATMLAYIGTDANVSGEVLQQILRDATRVSFNRITVDGDTSTNDACVLIATGKAAHARLEATDGHEYRALRDAVVELCQVLAQAIIRDGEGATRLLTIDVYGGASEAECEQVAFTIAHSPLVKTALFAGDPNWGRILAAVGRAGVEAMDLEAVSIYLDDVCIVQHGGRATDYTEEQGQAVMAQPELSVKVDLGRGTEQVRVWTCDLSYDYVRINAEYRT
jgi:glutamate N-acetyltransferase/amino-acid N-acetyltransferase